VIAVNLHIILLIAAAVGALAVSYRRDSQRTWEGLKVARSRFGSIAGDILAVLALVSLFLTVVPPSVISSLLGSENVALSGLAGATIGTVTIMPAFVAFPLSASLIAKGAHLVAVAAFITTLTMVGFATAPIEREYFGMRFTVVRNIVSFLAALDIAGGMVVLYAIL
jgi:uncharacterized membrane protein YraQ (UPF0718 family)